jgi:hypothetical protein
MVFPPAMIGTNRGWTSRERAASKKYLKPRASVASPGHPLDECRRAFVACWNEPNGPLSEQALSVGAEGAFSPFGPAQPTFFYSRSIHGVARGAECPYALGAESVRPFLLCGFDRAGVIVDDAPAFWKALPYQREHAAEVSFGARQMPMA